MVLRPILLMLVLSHLPVLAARADSVLHWRPGKDVPQAAVMVERFKDNDLGLSVGNDCESGLGKYARLSSVLALFTGGDHALLADFQQQFGAYHVSRHNGQHPAHPAVAQPDIQLYTYLAPYEYHQEHFLAWMRDKLGRDDYFLPAARRANPYRGHLVWPVGNDPNAVDSLLLQQTMGYVAVAQAERVTLIGDNRYRPTRWIAPVNEIHHHEQAAWSLVIHSAPGQYDTTAQIFRDFHRGERHERLILEYDLTLHLKDFSHELQEQIIWDYYASNTPPAGQDPTAQLHLQAIKALQPDADELLPLEKQMIRAWLAGRLLEPNFHLVVGVNFSERNNRYRLAEFMLASYNQRPSFRHPADPNGPEPDNLGFYCTASERFDPCVVDGGNSGAVAWTRFPIDLLARPDFLASDPAIDAVILEGGEYVRLERPHLPACRLRGRIDLTAFYTLSRKHGFFPGQRGYWVNRWVGFEGDAPEYRDPNETHGVEWACVLFENHGPFRVEIEVNHLDIQKEYNTAADAQP